MQAPEDERIIALRIDADWAAALARGVVALLLLLLLLLTSIVIIPIFNS